MPALPVLMGGLKLAGKAAPLMSKLVQGGVLVGAPAAAISYISDLPRKAMQEAVAVGPDPVTGTYESRVKPYLRPFVPEENMEEMGKRRAAYLRRTEGRVKQREALLRDSGVKLDPGEEVDDFLIRTQEAADTKKADKEWKAFTKRAGYVSPEMQSQIDAQKVQNEAIRGQLEEVKASRIADNKARAQDRLDAINAQTAQLEYQKGRDASDMRRFELLLDREDKKDAAERRKALIQGLANLGGALAGGGY